MPFDVGIEIVVGGNPQVVQRILFMAAGMGASRPQAAIKGARGTALVQPQSARCTQIQLPLWSRMSASRGGPESDMAGRIAL